MLIVEILHTAVHHKLALREKNGVVHVLKVGD